MDLSTRHTYARIATEHSRRIVARRSFRRGTYTMHGKEFWSGLIHVAQENVIRLANLLIRAGEPK